MLELQKRSGASVVEAHGWQLPRSWSSPDAEYEALASSVALVDRSHVGRLQIDGSDGVDLLNRMSTNQLLDMAPGQGVSTVLTSNKGRIVDVLLVLNLGDHLLVFTGPENRAAVAEAIDFYTFGEDVAVSDVTENTAMLALAGPGAAALVDALSDRRPRLDPYASQDLTIGGVDALLVRSDFLGAAEYELIAPAEQAPALWEALVTAGASHGLTPVGQEVLEAVRVERGVPSPGRELGEAYNPLEAGLLHLVSFTKGCYVGQEVVTRLNTYQKVQKHLVGLTLEGEVLPSEGARIVEDGKQTGVVTSVAVSASLGGGIALAYVRKSHSEPGTRVEIEAGDGTVPAVVSELPFSS